MCEAVRYLFGEDLMSVAFSSSGAKLPVLLKDGSIRLLPWGRRSSQKGNLPLGGCASLDSIYAGKWDKYFPQSVKIPYTAFMQRDFEGRAKWYENLVTKINFIQGLVAKEGNEKRIYIVMTEPDIDVTEFHDRWPRIL